MMVLEQLPRGNVNIVIVRSSFPEVLLRKDNSKNMQQIYRRRPMPKCGFNKVALNHTSAWVFSCKFATYFQNTFS